MPAPVSIEQLVILEKVVARFPDGATLEQIAQALVPPASQRTASRWLGILIERRRVQRIGQARNTRYRALHPPSTEAARVSAAVAPSEPIAAQRELRQSAGVSACPPDPGADLTEQIFAAAIGDVVRFKMSRATAVMVLQRMTELNIASVDDRRACLALLKARLNALTETEAERYGLEREQYRAWSENDAAVVGAAGAGVVGDKAERPTSKDFPAAESGRKAPPTVGDNASGSGDAALQQTAKSVRPSSTELSRERDGRFGPDGGEASAPSADPNGHSAPNDAASGFQQTAADMKRLMTPGRLAVSALWAGCVSTATTHLVGGGAAQAVTFLMAGVPPLLFVDRDRVAANNPMDLRAKLTMLVAGGSGSMLCAAPVSYVLESVVGMFR